MLPSEKQQNKTKEKKRKKQNLQMMHNSLGCLTQFLTLEIMAECWHLGVDTTSLRQGSRSDQGFTDIWCEKRVGQNIEYIMFFQTEI